MKICLEATAEKISFNVTLPAFVTAVFDVIARTARAIEEDTRPTQSPLAPPATTPSWYERIGAIPTDIVTRENVRDVMHQETGHVLADVEWRLAQTRDLLNEMKHLAGYVDSRLGDGVVVSTRPGNVLPFTRQLTAEDLNTTNHALTGYTTTNNTDTTGAVLAGSIRWQSLQIIYKGVQYNVTDSATLLKFTYFVKAGFVTVVTAPSTDGITGVVTPAVFSGTLTSSNTKPTLTPDDLLVFVNNNGVVYVAGGDSAASLPGVIADGTVDNGAIQANAVTGINILANSIGSGKLGTGAINLATQFMSGVVTATVLGRSAVTATSLNTTAHTLI